VGEIVVLTDWDSEMVPDTVTDTLPELLREPLVLQLPLPLPLPLLHAEPHADDKALPLSAVGLADGEPRFFSLFRAVGDFLEVSKREW